MKRALSTSLFLLLVVAGNAHAWWGTPYNGYWPNAWPSQNVQRGYYPYGVQPQGYGGPGWNMRGYITQRGDMNVVIEYRGNINQDFFGGRGRYPGYGAYQRSPYYGYGWR
ncbi:MAG: hypothetical protein HKM94_03570 [Halobacteria archaeon]|nr:hypothetical protein [Halobacteria archaeon]